MSRPDAIVEITATIRFKIWVDRYMIDESGEYTLEAIAKEYLSLRVNDFPTMQADIESVDSAKVLDEGPYEPEAVECSKLRGLLLRAKRGRIHLGTRRVQNVPRS